MSYKLTRTTTYIYDQIYKDYSIHACVHIYFVATFVFKKRKEFNNLGHKS